MEDLTEQANEIQEVMGRSYGMPEIDDDELEVSPPPHRVLRHPPPRPEPQLLH